MLRECRLGTPPWPGYGAAGEPEQLHPWLAHYWQSGLEIVLEGKSPT
jgi:hypothetical protein